jgi:hypothetical protein
LIPIATTAAYDGDPSRHQHGETLEPRAKARRHPGRRPRGRSARMGSHGELVLAVALLLHHDRVVLGGLGFREALVDDLHVVEGPSC